ncbi:MAG TPA: dihydroorotate dehydrogenase [Planctomycetota bacterium]|nr:dihydroorotate dehydrogenase [Planctomycetota bacterium]
MKDNPGVKLAVNVGGLALATPMLVASGTYGWGTEFEEIEGFSSAAISGIVLKGTTLERREGNRTPRIVETAGGAGILNAIGLENPGVEYVVKHYLPRLKDVKARVIANVAGATVEEYAEVTSRLAGEARIDAVEVNVSCPNVKRGGMQFGADADVCGQVVRGCRKATRKPLIVKLSPNVTDIRPIAGAAVDAGADVLTIANTVLGTAVDVRTRRPILGNVSGGLSGPAVKPIALQKVMEVACWLKSEGLKTPVIASGGIMTGEDALEFMVAGARAFAIGTVLFADVKAPERIMNEMRDLLAELGVTDVNDVVGTLQLS